MQSVKGSPPYDGPKFILFSNMCTENHLKHVGSLAEKAMCATDGCERLLNNKRLMCPK